MSTFNEVKKILIDVLHLNAHSAELRKESLLLGGLAELDSINVVSVITELESHFDIQFEYAEMNGQVFSTLGSLVELVDHKLHEKV